MDKWTPERIALLVDAVNTEESFTKVARKLNAIWGTNLQPEAFRRKFGQQPNIHKVDIAVASPPKEEPAEPAWKSYHPKPGFSLAAVPEQGQAESVEAIRTIVIPDTHVPYQHQKAWATTLALLKDLHPHQGVIIGDFMDMESLSRHPRSRPDLAKLAEEYYQTNLALDALQEVSPGTKWHFLEGNHEARATRWINEHGELDGMFDVPACLYMKPANSYWRSKHADTERGITWVGLDSQPYMNDFAAFQHGNLTSIFTPNHAAWYANIYGPSRGQGRKLVVYGDKHTFQAFRSANGHSAQCCGFLGDANQLKYVQGRPLAWQLGLLLYENVGVQYSCTYLYFDEDGRCLFNGKLY